MIVTSIYVSEVCVYWYRITHRQCVCVSAVLLKLGIVWYYQQGNSEISQVKVVDNTGKGDCTLYSVQYTVYKCIHCTHTYIYE